MVWLRIDSNVPKQRKFVDAGPVASWLWLAGVAHCRTALTDGFIQKALVPTLVPDLKNPFKQAERLVNVTLWHHALGGYQVNGYLEWNPSKAEVERLRKMDADRKKGRRSGMDSESDSGMDSGRIPNDTSTRGRELSLLFTSGSDLPKAETPQAAFARFWQAYPSKVGKGAAEKAFAKHAGIVDTLIEAVDRQVGSKQWRKDGGQYIPHPATWLNQRRWEDELPKSTSAAHATAARVHADVQALCGSAGLDNYTVAEWFAGVTLERGPEGAVTLRVADADIAGYIERNFGERLRAAAERKGAVSLTVAA